MNRVCPENVALVADWVHSRYDANLPFAISGATSRVSSFDHEQLDLSGLTKVRMFTPDDMVIGVEAGLPVKELKAILAEKNMYLPSLSWFPQATIGGMVACNEFGPFRNMGGGLRDHIIGIEYVNGLGKTVKAGGQVVKNVTGYDISRFMLGSWGSFGAITAIWLKVLPQRIQPQVLYLKELHKDWRVPIGHLQRSGLPFDWLQLRKKANQRQLAIGISGNTDLQQQLHTQIQGFFDEPLITMSETELPEDFSNLSTTGFLNSALPTHIYGAMPTDVFLDPFGIDLLNLTEEAVLHPIGGDVHWFSKNSDKPCLKDLQMKLGKFEGHLQLQTPKGPTLARNLQAKELLKNLKKSVDPKHLFRSPLDRCFT